MTDSQLPIQILSDPAQLAQRAAQEFVDLSATAIAERGRFLVVLSGGNTPRATLRLLASRGLADRVDWQHVFVFWGDERCVPPDNAESNYGMARQMLLARVPIPSQNIHRMQGELDPSLAADTYEALLHQYIEEDHLIRFDLIYLGMGEDGHTASLFPGTDAIHEKQRWVMAHYIEKMGMWRITLTPPVLNAAAHIRFLVQGSAKAETVWRVLLGPRQVEQFPSQIIQSYPDGDLLWLIDRAAAQKILSQEQ